MNNTTKPDCNEVDNASINNVKIIVETDSINAKAKIINNDRPGEEQKVR